MSWDSYITTLMDDKTKDAAIVGFESGKESVWAAHAGGDFAKITPEEIRKLVGSDRSCLFGSGVTLAGIKCTVVRDQLYLDGQFTLDLRTKITDQEAESLSISVGKSKTCLVIVKGKAGIAGGTLNTVVYKMSEHLRCSNC